MVWKFLDLANPKAARKRRLVVEQIDRWWHEFRAKADDLDALFRGRKQWDLPAWVHTHLQAVNPNLMWEFGQDPATGGLYLVITPENKRHLRPLVETILERAPRLDGWSFYAHRQPEPLVMARETVRAKTGADLALTAASARIGDLHRIDLLFQEPDGAGGDEGLLGQAFAATESLLGEEVLDRWVGAIDVGPARGGHGFPLERLRSTVEALTASIREQLPDRPCLERLDGAEWSVFKGEPEEADDYPGWQDLLVGSTMLPDMWQCAHGDPGFYSLRWSRCGETFCYLKIDGSEGPDAEKFADRSAVEDALNAVLVPARAGCVVGGGTGLRYSYIELALTDVRRAAELIRRRLRAGNVPRRSWLLFHDCEWRREWLGVWDDTPPPPR